MATVEITLAAAVRNQQRLHRKSPEDMAQFLGLSPQQYRDLIDCRWIPHQSTVIRLARCFRSQPTKAWLRHRLYSLALASKQSVLPCTDISDQLALRICDAQAWTIVREQLVMTPFLMPAVPLRLVFWQLLKELREVGNAPYDTDWVGICRPELLPGGLPRAYQHPSQPTACVRLLTRIPRNPSLRPRGAKSVLIDAAYHAMHGGYHVRLYRERRSKLRSVGDRIALLIYCPPQPDKDFDPWQGVTTPWIPTLPPSRRAMWRMELAKQAASTTLPLPSGEVIFEYPDEQ